MPPFPEAEDDTYRVYIGGRYEYATSGYRAIENFFDLAHFPFVHPGLLGDEAHPELPDYDVEVTNEGLIVTNTRFLAAQADQYPRHRRHRRETTLTTCPDR